MLGLYTGHSLHWGCLRTIAGKGLTHRRHRHTTDSFVILTAAASSCQGISTHGSTARFSYLFLRRANQPSDRKSEPAMNVISLPCHHDTTHSLDFSSLVGSVSPAPESESEWIDWRVGDRLPSSTEGGPLEGAPTSSFKEGGVCSTSLASTVICPLMVCRKGL